MESDSEVKLSNLSCRLLLIRDKGTLKLVIYMIQALVRHMQAIVAFISDVNLNEYDHGRKISTLLNWSVTCHARHR